MTATASKLVSHFVGVSVPIGVAESSPSSVGVGPESVGLESVGGCGGEEDGGGVLRHNKDKCFTWHVPRFIAVMVSEW